MNQGVFPSIEELIPEELQAKLPSLLVNEITERYNRLGWQYLSDDTWPDGRRINKMMYTNRVENCIEELVDAVFCVLGWIFKHSVTDGHIPDSAYAALTGLIDVYTLMVAEKNDPVENTIHV